MFKNSLIKNHLVPIGIILVLIGASWSKLHSYLHLNWSANILWIALLPFIIYIKDKQVYSWKYGWVALVALTFYAFVEAPIFFFFGFCFTVFFIIEAFYGRLNRLTPLAVILVTPLTAYLFNIFGFPIRLVLTEIAANLLSQLSTTVSSHGNLLSYQGEVFSVDNACMGLRMVIISFLICLLLISHFEKPLTITLKLSLVSVSLLLTSGLVILSNFLRIIFLILFNSPPGSLSHELIGLAALFLVVIVPLFMIIRLFAIRFQSDESGQKEPFAFRQRSTYMLPSFTAMLILFLGLKPSHYIDMPPDQVIENMTMEGYDKEILDSNVGKFTNDISLIYIKPSKGFYRSDHSPVACWRGSGYAIKNESRHEFLGKEVYLASLVSEKSTLHTAWWYDNGDHQTIDQLDWRWRMIKGEKPFQLINVTTASQQELINEITKLIK